MAAGSAFQTPSVGKALTKRDGFHATKELAPSHSSMSNTSVRMSRREVEVSTEIMEDMGRMLIVLGLVFIVAGVLITFGGRLPIRLGRLPGDIAYQGKNTSFYFPIVTCILLSVVLSLVMWVVNRFR